MIEREVVVTTKHGRMPCYTFCPDEPGRFPAVILYMDARGMREELCNLARRVANAGYFCLLPDMYYRMGTVRLETHRPTDAMASVWRACYLATTNAFVVDDTSGMLAWLDAQDKVKPGKVGCFGYCMSGQFIVSVAAHFPHRIGSAASLYGVKIITEEADSPHKLLDRVKAELYFAFAEIDRSVPISMTEELRGHLDRAGTKYEMEIFPGTHHGFGFPEREVFDTQASEHSWTKMLALWERTLK